MNNRILLCILFLVTGKAQASAPYQAAQDQITRMIQNAPYAFDAIRSQIKQNKDQFTPEERKQLVVKLEELKSKSSGSRWSGALLTPLAFTSTFAAKAVFYFYQATYAQQSNHWRVLFDPAKAFKSARTNLIYFVVMSIVTALIEMEYWQATSALQYTRLQEKIDATIQLLQQ